jgi:hypothetical protein
MCRGSNWKEKGAMHACRDGDLHPEGWVRICQVENRRKYI